MSDGRMLVDEHRRLVDQLIRHEGKRLKAGTAQHEPYRDTVGKLTVGYGRNLDDVGLSEDEALFLLVNDIDAVGRDLQTFSWFRTLDPVRRVALMDMRYQLGASGFRGFKKMIAALERGDFETAAVEARESKWARQVPSRAGTVIRQLQFGER